MGVPDRPSPGKHGLAGSAGGQGQPRDGVPPKKRYILTFRNSLDPASLLKTKRKRIRTQRSQDCLPSENIYRRQKHPPHPKTTRHLPLGCRPFDDCLSRRTLQETETFEEGEEDLKPSFTF